MTTQTLGERIKERRKELGLTLQNVADKSGSCKSYIWEMENKIKDPGISTIIAIADALSCSLSWLATGKDDGFTAGYDNAVENFKVFVDEMERVG